MFNIPCSSVCVGSLIFICHKNIYTVTLADHMMKENLEVIKKGKCAFALSHILIHFLVYSYVTALKAFILNYIDATRKLLNRA